MTTERAHFFCKEEEEANRFEREPKFVMHTMHVFKEHIRTCNLCYNFYISANPSLA